MPIRDCVRLFAKTAGAFGLVCTGPAFAAAGGATETAWFGLPAPGPATEQVLDFSRADLPMVPAPDVAKAPELKGDLLMQYVKQVVDFSYLSRAAGDRIWGRMAGSKWAEMTTDYVADQFRRAGLQNVTKYPVPFAGPETIASDWKVSLVGLPEFGAGSGDVELRSAIPMGASPEGTSGPVSAIDGPPQQTWAVTAPVVYVGSGSVADVALANVKGKVAVLRMEPAPAMFYSPVIRMAQQMVTAGAVGVIVIYDTPGNVQVRFGSCAHTPCFIVGGEDGDFLTTVIAKAAKANLLDKVQVSLSVTQVTKRGQNGWLLVGKLPGRQSNGNLVVSAHSDSYFAGANDNASGVAGLIGLARHYAKGAKPQHDMYFVLSPGHHSPTGATQSFTEHYPAVAPANIMTLNLEHIGQQATYRSYFNPTGMGAALTRYGNRSNVYVPVNGDSPGREISGGPITPAVKKILADAVRRSGFTAPAVIGGGPVAELGPIVKAGATGLQDVETSIWYHTSGDTVAAVNPVTLQRATLFYKDILDQSDKLTRAQMRLGAP